MNGRAAIYYREQQTLEASIVLRDLLADGGNDHEQTLRRCAHFFLQSLPVNAGFQVRDFCRPRRVIWSPSSRFEDGPDGELQSQNGLG